MAEVVLDGVGKRFPDGTAAVSDVRLRIGHGEFFILVGPSGCGKSTLLNLIVGLEAVTEGSIRVDGEDITHLDPKDRNMAMVFQSYALYPHMTVAGNLSFPLRLARVPEPEVRARVAEVAGVLGLGDLLDRLPVALSGGQRQRVAMGRALVRRPRVFLLDEPLSNLDARLRSQMRAEIARLQRRLGTTTVYVTHDQTEAMTLGQRVAVMRAGRVLQVGTPRELYDRPATLFVAGFIGSPAMNFIPGRVADGRLVTPAGETPAPPAVLEWARGGGTALVAGVRPEDLEVGPPGAGAMGFEARVEMAEWLGADLYVYLDLPGWADGSAAPPPVAGPDLPGWGRVVVRQPPQAPVSRGDPVPIRIDPGRLHLFDAAGGQRIGD